MGIARKGFVGLAWLFVISVAVQFFLAGLAVLGGGSMELHRQWGFTALHLIPISMVIAAGVGRMGWGVVGRALGLFLLVFLQSLFASPDLSPQWLRAFHVLDALFILALGLHLVRRREADRRLGPDQVTLEA